jgi:hypothetical protein
MSKKHNEQNEVEVAEAPTKEVKPSRIIDVAGEKVNFGVRAKVLSAYDAATKTITFYLATSETEGKKLEWPVQGTEGLNDFQLQVFLYGLSSKVKASLAAIKDIGDVEVAINKQIEAINAGTFILRSGKEATLSLDNLQKAYAIVKAANEAEFAHWANVDDATVIQEVLARWSTFTVSDKNGLRKNAYIVLEKAKLDAADASKEVTEETPVASLI